MADEHILHTFFSPKNVAIVGASSNPLSINYRLADNLIRAGFKGKIFPVNSSVNETIGLRAYANLKHIADQDGLVVSAVLASMTMNIMRRCVDKNVCNVIIKLMIDLE